MAFFTNGQIALPTAQILPCTWRADKINPKQLVTRQIARGATGTVHWFNFPIVALTHMAPREVLTTILFSQRLFYVLDLHVALLQQGLDFVL